MKILLLTLLLSSCVSLQKTERVKVHQLNSDEKVIICINNFINNRVKFTDASAFCHKLIMDRQ